MELAFNKSIRQYRNLYLQFDAEDIADSNDRRLLQIALKAFENVTKLELDINLSVPEDWQLLNSFAQVEQLVGRFYWHDSKIEVPDDVRAPMINLKKLTFIGNPSVVEYFENCTFLTDCVLYLESNSKDNATVVEDFLFKQKNLKNLTLVSYGSFKNVKLFQQDRSAEVPFQLESLSIDLDVCGENMHKIIAQQKSLTQCTFDVMRRPAANNTVVLKAILMLPQLQSLTVDNFHSIADLKDIRNTSIKQLTVNPIVNASEVLENFAVICPNAEIIASDQWNLQLKDLPSEDLRKLELTDCKQFRYQPEAIPEDQHAFEEHVLAFIRRHKNITRLTIGHKNWLQHEAFGLSHGFIKDLLQFVPALKSLEIYSNAGSRQLFSYISSIESQLETYEICHSNGTHFYKQEAPKLSN